MLFFSLLAFFLWKVFWPEGRPRPKESCWWISSCRKCCKQKICPKRTTLLWGLQLPQYLPNGSGCLSLSFSYSFSAVLTYHSSCVFGPGGSVDVQRFRSSGSPKITTIMNCGRVLDRMQLEWDCKWLHSGSVKKFVRIVSLEN